jgi:hypothetical protein
MAAPSPGDSLRRRAPQRGQNVKSGEQGASQAGQVAGSLLPQLGQKAKSR